MVFIPFVRGCPARGLHEPPLHGQRTIWLLLDNASAHKGLWTRILAAHNNVRLLFLPAGMTFATSPLDARWNACHKANTESIATRDGPIGSAVDDILARVDEASRLISREVGVRSWEIAERGTEKFHRLMDAWREAGAPGLATVLAKTGEVGRLHIQAGIREFRRTEPVRPSVEAAAKLNFLRVSFSSEQNATREEQGRPFLSCTYVARHIASHFGLEEECVEGLFIERPGVLEFTSIMVKITSDAAIDTRAIVMPSVCGIPTEWRWLTGIKKPILNLAFESAKARGVYVRAEDVAAAEAVEAMTEVGDAAHKVILDEAESDRPARMAAFALDDDYSEHDSDVDEAPVEALDEDEEIAPGQKAPHVHVPPATKKAWNHQAHRSVMSFHTLYSWARLCSAQFHFDAISRPAGCTCTASCKHLRCRCEAKHCTLTDEDRWVRARIERDKHIRTMAAGDGAHEMYLHSLIGRMEENPCFFHVYPEIGGYSNPRGAKRAREVAGEVADADPPKLEPAKRARREVTCSVCHQKGHIASNRKLCAGVAPLPDAD